MVPLYRLGMAFDADTRDSAAIETLIVHVWKYPKRDDRRCPTFPFRPVAAFSRFESLIISFFFCHLQHAPLTLTASFDGSSKENLIERTNQKFGPIQEIVHFVLVLGHKARNDLWLPSLVSQTRVSWPSETHHNSNSCRSA
jgi:hypothetical protein